jgi:hypothetical protein
MQSIAKESQVQPPKGKFHHIIRRITTLNIVLSGTYFLELCNAIIIYCISHFFANKGHMGRLVTYSALILFIETIKIYQERYVKLYNSHIANMHFICRLVICSIA